MYCTIVGLLALCTIVPGTVVLLLVQLQDVIWAIPAKTFQGRYCICYDVTRINNDSKQNGQTIFLD